MEDSDRKIEVDDNCGYGTCIKLSELPSLTTFLRVMCEVRVVSIGNEKTVNATGLTNQDVMVSDGTGTEKLTVWGSEIGKMKEERCYSLKGVVVKEYYGNKHLSTAKENCKIEEIDRLDGEDGLNHCNVRVIGVETLTVYSGCMKCEGEVLHDAGDPEIGTCGECGIMQVIGECSTEVTANLIIKSGSGKLYLRAFGEVVEHIAEKSRSDLTKVSLLKVGQFDMETHDGVIKAIKR